MTQEEFDTLIAANQPHQVLNLDFRHYYALNFADAFLPKANLIKGKGLIVYDGVELFKTVRPTTADYFQLTDTNQLITMLILTYPKGVEAELKKDRVLIIDHEIVMFIELDADENIEMYFRFGRNFREFLTDQKISIYGMENRVYRTTLDKFHQNIADGITA